MGEACTADSLLTSAVKVASESNIENSPQSANDSGHESNSSSSPELPLTPDEERASSPGVLPLIVFFIFAAGKSNEESTNGLLGDTMFRIQIVAPGAEPFDLQVNSGEMVQELHQVLLEREQTCHRTCFSLQLNGVALDHFTEMRNIIGLRDGSVLKVVEEPYTTREARIHLRHVRELVRSLDTVDALSGADGASLSYLPSMTLGDRKKSLDRTVECYPPEYILPGYKERPLTPLMAPLVQLPYAVKSIAISPYNPPPGPRKMKGDVLYLTVDTREGRRYHITCCTRGFYVNATTDTQFRPTISSSHRAIHHSLIDLLSSISPIFKKAISVIIKKRAEKHIFERLPTPYQVNTWFAPSFNQTEDAIRAEDGTQPHRIGLEDHIPGQIRDWNEELQATHELPRENLAERLIRERAIFKIHSDFVSAAVKGAMSVLDGNVFAINPADEPRTHMFIWNNIFFSLGFDVKDHYKELGGDAAAHAATSNDLQGVRAYAQLDTSKLFTLGMVIIDYKGYRVTAQSIIPGILEREQEQSVVYGSIDFGKTVVSSEKYHTLLEKPAEQLKILPHEVYSSEEGDQKVKLYSSFETKGIVGTDGRHYILDLLRTFPPDVNYLEGAEVTEICKANGYPRPFPHKLVSLRQELVDAFVEYFLSLLLLAINYKSVKQKSTFGLESSFVKLFFRYLMFVRIAAYHIQQPRIKSNNEVKDENETKEANEDDENKQHLQLPDAEDLDNPKSEDAIVNKIKSEIIANAKESGLPEAEAARKLVGKVIESEEKKDDDGLNQEISNQIMAKAAEAVGSSLPGGFDIRFNPDCYCTTVKHAETEDLQKQRRFVAEAAEFLLVQQLPNFVRECLHHALMPVDGSSLTETMHSRGINIRYLGKLTKCIANVEQLSYLKTVCVCELLCRSAKHLFREYLQPVGAAHLAIAISHFLNCLLGKSGPYSLGNGDESSINGVKKAKSTKKKKQSSGNGKESEHWAQLSTKILWSRLISNMDSHYAYSSEAENLDAFTKEGKIQKTSILRRFCQLVGIQILLRDYHLETGKKSLPFTEDDIQNLYPVVKHVDPKAFDAHSLFISAQTKVQQGSLRAGFELAVEALNLMNNVYGAMHPDMAQCMRLLARLSYILGDPAEALSQQHKATLMSERCNGLDNASIIVEYLNLAHFTFANLHIVASLKLLYRARYLLLLIHGDDHPLMAQIDGNIGVLLYAVQEYDEALRFLQSALQLHKKYMEPRALKTALIYHLMARTYSCRGDFRTALQMEKETFIIYSKTFGKDHEKTKESEECLRHITQQAVTFQKRLNEANRQGTSNITQLLPIEIHRPSLQSVLEILNILNGIIFIQLKNAESSEIGKVTSDSVDAVEDSSNSNPSTTMQEEALD
uniref:Clustered mitochondria protein homolog n=1 Tax=Syphacia muris TaxID=451379 RepID=A0A158R5N9_9BILA